jgi:CheY-like chemotaxis protein
VTAVSDPRQALARFAADPEAFDLVITDLTMPRMTGIELAQHLLELRPSIPVLLTSGFSAEWSAESVRALGIYGLLDKPVMLPVLAAAVRNALADASRAR